MVLHRHGLRGGQYGPHDVVISGAAANVAFQALTYRAPIETHGMLHQVDCRHDHAGSAETALQGMALAKRGLHRMQRINGSDTFDGRNRRAICLTGQHGATLHSPSIEMDRARATLARITADMGSRQPQSFANDVNEECIFRHIERMLGTIYGQIDLHVVIVPRAPLKNRVAGDVNRFR